MDKNKGMTLIVKTITRLTVGLIILFGIYIVSRGHLSPGGGFAGGVIIALAFVNLLLAYGDVGLKKFPFATAEVIEAIGAIFFVLISIFGLIISGIYFYNFLGTGQQFNLISAGIILPANTAIALKVGAGLYGIVVALVLAKSLLKKKQ